MATTASLSVLASDHVAAADDVYARHRGWGKRAVRATEVESVADPSVPRLTEMAYGVLEVMRPAPATWRPQFGPLQDAVEVPESFI